MIDTREGARPIEELRAGDQVLTVDRGAQALRWTGSRSLDLRGNEHLRPVRIAAGALGQGLPLADLVVSRQPRVLVRSAIARRMFGADEVLVAAKHLVSLPGIEVVEDAAQVTYIHLLFDRHELVTSNGAVSESLFTGPEALKGVSEAARAEILGLFPRLAEIGKTWRPPCPSGRWCRAGRAAGWPRATCRTSFRSSRRTERPGRDASIGCDPVICFSCVAWSVSGVYHRRKIEQART